MVCDKIDETTINEHIVAHHCLIIAGLSGAMWLLSLRYAVDSHGIGIILFHSLIVYCLVRLGRASNHHHVLPTAATGLL